MRRKPPNETRHWSCSSSSSRCCWCGRLHVERAAGRPCYCRRHGVAEYLWEALRDGTLLEGDARDHAAAADRLFHRHRHRAAARAADGTSDYCRRHARRARARPADACRACAGCRWRCCGSGRPKRAMLFVVVMGTVWSVIIATDTGVRTIPPIYARAARTMGSEGFTCGRG